MDEMTERQRRERRIQEIMEMHGWDRGEAELAVAVERGELPGDAIEIADANGEE